jgi:hypothetical protein
MSDTVTIVLIVAIAVVVVLIIFRKQLSRFFIQADQEGIKAELETHEQATASSDDASVRISGSKQLGKSNVLEVQRDDVIVEDTLQAGEDQRISVKADPVPSEVDEAEGSKTEKNSQAGEE